MKLSKSESLMQAEGVLNSLQKLFDEDMRLMVLTDCSFIVESYQNGREQGYTICAHIPGDYKTFYIAKTRSSDSIVVYFGDSSNISISENAYRNGKYFREGEFDEAANYIVDTIIHYYNTTAILLRR